MWSNIATEKIPIDKVEDNVAALCFCVYLWACEVNERKERERERKKERKKKREWKIEGERESKKTAILMTNKSRCITIESIMTKINTTK